MKAVGIASGLFLGLYSLKYIMNNTKSLSDFIKELDAGKVASVSFKPLIYSQVIIGGNVLLYKAAAAGTWTITSRNILSNGKLLKMLNNNPATEFSCSPVDDRLIGALLALIIPTVTAIIIMNSM